MHNKDDRNHSLAATKIVIVMVIAKIIIGSTLLLALGNWNSSFYDILRILIFISSIVFVYKFFRDSQIVWAWSFVAVGILFNPIYPIYLQKDMWKIIDLVAAILLFSSISKDIDFLKTSTTKRFIAHYASKIILFIVVLIIFISSILFFNSPLSFFSAPKIEINTSFASKVTVSGSASPLSTIQIYVDGKYNSLAKVNNNGSFSKQLIFDDDDVKIIKARQSFYIFNSDFSENITYFNIRINPQYKYLLNN